MKFVISNDRQQCFADLKTIDQAASRKTHSMPPSYEEEEGGIMGLLASLQKVAARDTLISEGKSLNKREEALLHFIPIPDWLARW